MILLFKIKQIVDGLLDWVQHDYDKNREEDTFLYQMFNGVENGRFDFYEQAKKLFLRTEESPRKLKTSLEYPKDRNPLPCIVIRETSKKFSEEMVSGVGMEYFIADPESSYHERESFFHLSESNFNLMCFSDNTIESILMGEVLYTLFYGAHNTFEDDFVSFKFNLSELMIENQIFPVPLVIKNIMVDVKFSDNIASIIGSKIIKDVEFDLNVIK